MGYPMAHIWMGDAIEAALKKIGITEEGVDARLKAIGWIWGCGCKNRKERLNRLDQWASSTTNSGIDVARTALQSLFAPKTSDAPETPEAPETDNG